jgi:uncharacterized protein (DUF3820 family)
VTTTLRFGRYRGRPLTDVPPSYLRWLLERGNLGPAPRVAVKHALGIVVATPPAATAIDVAEGGA